MLPPKPRPRLPMQSGHGSAPPASGVVHGHPDRWCSRHRRRPSRALRRVCAVSTAARQFDVQPVFAALAICTRCETRLIPEQRWPVQPPASSVSFHELCSQQHRHLLAVRPRPQEGGHLTLPGPAQLNATGVTGPRGVCEGVLTPRSLKRPAPVQADVHRVGVAERCSVNGDGRGRGTRLGPR